MGYRMGTKNSCHIIFSLIITLCAFTSIAATGDYTLGPEDVIEISVYEQPDLSRSVTVRPDGKITCAYIGDVLVDGLTPMETAAKIKEELSVLVRDPVVTVTLLAFRSKKVYILGEVRSPGAYPLTSKMNVFDATATAGTMTVNSDPSKVRVVRPSTTGDPRVFEVNLSKVIKKGDASENFDLEPGDIVFVPKNGLAQVSFDLEQILQPISTLATPFSLMAVFNNSNNN
jgi:polysaccharide biosynthesis/export protein